MIAKNRRYLKILQEALRTTSVIRKNYRAIVHGDWPSRLVRIDASIEKNLLSSGERISRVSESGKAARTEFTVLARGAGLTLLAIKPITEELIKSGSIVAMRVNQLLVIPNMGIQMRMRLSLSYLIPAG